MRVVPTHRNKIQPTEDGKLPKIIFQGPPSEIIQDLKGAYTDAERSARVRLVLQWRAAMSEEAGYEQMLAQIAMLQQVEANGDGQRERETAQRLKDEQNRIRREKIDIRCRAVLEKEQRNRPPAQQPFKIRRWGRRQARDKPLTEDELYLDDARPALILRPRMDHICVLCHNAKSHPVLLPCGHSHCYVCIRVSLETQWACPECEKAITRGPVPHDIEAAAIERDNPGWDNSRVAYLWDGLVFPRAHGLIRFRRTSHTVV